jgi:hypothetical protein
MVNKSDSEPRFSKALIEQACGRPSLPEETIAAMEELSGAVMMALSDRVKSGQVGWHKNQITDSEAKNFLYRMLKSCHGSSLAPPRELILLAQIVLGQDKPPHRRVLKWVPREEAKKYVMKNPRATLREIGKHVGVNASTVLRWNVAPGKSVRNT